MFLNPYGPTYKKSLLEMHKNNIDKGVEDLVNAINEIDVLVTMNSCQGKLIPEEKEEHCPKTYVDFYVLYHQYHVANKLFSELTHKFGGMIYCKIWYEADVDFINDNEVEDNGMINLRYSIEIYPESLTNADKTYKEIVSEVKKFGYRRHNINEEGIKEILK